MKDSFEYRRKKRKNKKTFSLIIFLLIILGIIYFLYSSYNFNKNKKGINVDEIFEGINKTNIVKELIDKEIYNYNFDIKEKELLAYRKKRKEEELAKLLEKGKEVNPEDFKKVKVSKSSVNTVPISVYKEYFKEDLFIGDSITEELKYYKFLYDKNVFSKIGLNTDTLRKLIPDEDFVFVKTEEKFKERYLAMLDALEEKFPDAKIYLQAIFPVSKALDEKEDARVNNTKINSFNEVIKTIASEIGLDYLDFSYILKENEDYFEPDGMHLKSKFHKVWLNEVKNIH